MSKLEDEVAALRAEVDRLKPTPMPTEEDVARHRDEMHQQSEARASRGALTFYSREDLRAMRAACPDAQAIVRDHRNAPLGPAYQVPTSQPISNVRGPGGGTGWGYVAPIRNGIGEGK